MKELKRGFTTGSCAALGAKVASCMALFGRVPYGISIVTPAGVRYSPEYRIAEDGFCEVVKDAGDDPDVTDGITIRAGVRLIPSDIPGIRVTIDGGRGVGRVTKAGLDQPPGEAAINTVPRRMIEENVREIADRADFSGTIAVIIEATGGEKIAERTFNPRLGITGGISILGTTGIVEPMSDSALIDTIRVEIHQRRVLGEKRLFLAFGNYGQEFLKRDFGLDLDAAVKCSNFIKDALLIAWEEGYKELILVGHLGKIVKVAGGFSNTHSKYGDCRMEILTAALVRSGIPVEIRDLRMLLSMNTTEEAADFLAEKGFLAKVAEVLKEEIKETIGIWAPELRVEILIYTLGQGLIGEYK